MQTQAFYIDSISFGLSHKMDLLQVPSSEAMSLGKTQEAGFSLGSPLWKRFN